MSPAGVPRATSGPPPARGSSAAAKTAAGGAQAGRVACAILFLLPVLGAAGPHLPGIALPGINLFPFRLLILACLIVPVLLSPRIEWLRYPPMQLYLIVGTIWTLWGLASVFWTADEGAALAGSMVVMSGFLVGLALANLFAYSDRGLKWLMRGWVMAGIVSLMIAGWELLTGNHLPGTWIDSQPEYVRRFLAIATFHNPNNLAAFLLLLSSIMITYYLFGKKSKIIYPVYILLFFIFVVILVTGSRLSAAGFVMLLLMHIAFDRRVRSKAMLVAVLSLSILVPLLTQYSDTYPRMLALLDMFERGVSNDSSGTIRLNLTLAGFDMVASTWGLGVGAGNFQPAMMGGYKTFATSGLIDPHNWWIEVLSQYGVLVFFSYAFLWLYLLYVAAKSGIENFKKFIILGYAFFVAAFANSSYGAQTTNWLFHATLLMLAINTLISRRSHPIKPERQHPRRTA